MSDTETKPETLAAETPEDSVEEKTERSEDQSEHTIVGGCRMYEKEYPDADEVVLVHVKEVTPVGAYVSLLEYNNADGMILASELSRRRIRSINQVIRVGKTEAVVVIRVDREKGFIDLSKRRVLEEEVEQCKRRYAMSKEVHSIMSRVATQSGTQLIDLYKMFGWPLYRKYGHAYHAFQMIVTGNENILDEYQIPEKVKEYLLLNIKRRMTPQPSTIRATIEATCFGYEGIDAIKNALIAGRDSAPAGALEIRLKAPPLYTITTVQTDVKGGIEMISNAIKVIEAELAKYDGHLAVKDGPRVMSAQDETKLKADLEMYTKENTQVPDDDPIDE